MGVRSRSLYISRRDDDLGLARGRRDAHLIKLGGGLRPPSEASPRMEIARAKPALEVERQSVGDYSWRHPWLLVPRVGTTTSASPVVVVMPTRLMPVIRSLTTPPSALSVT